MSCHATKRGQAVYGTDSFIELTTFVYNVFIRLQKFYVSITSTSTCDALPCLSLARAKGFRLVT